MYPAIGLVELNSIARGIMVMDAMLKKAPVKLIEAMPICPGKYMVLIAGEVAPVESSLKVGLEVGAGYVVDELFLPNVHQQVLPAILALTEVGELEALGIMETFSIAASIVAADAAAKAADITLIEIRLAKGLGGKAYVTLTGEIADVEAAVAAGTRLAAPKGLLLTQVIIPAPHDELTDKIL
jgi:microcompartment protein CcmL/EutN